MKALISIEHPAWSWQFRKIINTLKKSGDDDVLVLAVEKDGDTELLRDFGIEYKLMANSTGRSIPEKAYLFLKLCITYTLDALKYKPDIIIGRASPMLGITSFVCRCPHLIFEDTEVSRFSLRICKVLSTRILTPTCFLSDLGNKQIRLPMYKELFYLHRDEFVPDETSLKVYGINSEEPYAIVRFVSWTASHDVGKGGLDDSDKISFVMKLNNQLRVYISSEDTLPKELEKYKLRTPYDVIHQVLYYATVVISEGASMASEAAILGTHSFYLNAIASGTTQEQEDRFHLLRVLHDQKTRYEVALEETEGLLARPNLWHEGKKKRERLLNEMPDPNTIFLSYMNDIVK